MLNGLGAILASLGFAILFNVKGDKLFTAAFIGGIGGVVYYASLYFGNGEGLSLFIASIIVSLLSEIFARLLKCPVTTFLLCAIIPLVPGGGMYYTMLEVISDNIDGAIVLGVETIIQACCIAIGCILVSSMTRIWSQTKRRKV
mgnify:CR=1 FL=1